MDALLLLLIHLTPVLPLLNVTRAVTPKAARAKAIQDEFIRQAEAKAKEGQKTADILSDGVIVGVGLIQRGQDQSK